MGWRDELEDEQPEPLPPVRLVADERADSLFPEPVKRPAQPWEYDS